MERMEIALLVMIISMPPYQCLADPSITGTTILGSTMSVSGSGFGTKQAAAPTLFEQFEDSVAKNGDDITVGGYWSHLDPANIKYNSNDQRTASSAFNIQDKLIYGVADTDFTSMVFPSTESPRKLFFSFWSKINIINVDATSYWQMKFWRIESNLNHGTYPSVACSVWYNLDGPPQTKNQEYVSLEGMTKDNNIWDMGYKIDQWTHTTVEIQESSAVDVRDGLVRVRVMNADGTGTDKIMNNIATRTTTYPNYMQYLKFGYDVTNNLNTGHEVHTFWDDIYADTSWARVQIGNNADYNSCTHLEEQKITSWSPTSIGFVINYGSFNAEDTKYVFVVDDNGIVSNGHVLPANDAPVNHKHLRIKKDNKFFRVAQ